MRSVEILPLAVQLLAYGYLRIPMGLKCASSVQKRKVYQLREIEVEVVVNDLLVCGKTEEHRARLVKALQKESEVNSKPNTEVQNWLWK